MDAIHVLAKSDVQDAITLLSLLFLIYFSSAYGLIYLGPTQIYEFVSSKMAFTIIK